MTSLQKRINYQDDLRPLLERVCTGFSLGEYVSHSILPIGYEDFNLRLTTQKGTYMVKIFATFRDERNCKRYIEIIRNVLSHGISHPKLYESTQGFIYTVALGNTVDRLCVMEYVEGKSYFELQQIPSLEEARFILKQATLINNMQLKPDYVYDNWAIVNFPKQYERKKEYLTKEDRSLLAPLIEKFAAIPFAGLPHSFVHGDITKTNTIKGFDGKIWIVDFAVSNYYPRILELAALFSDLFFDHHNPNSFVDIYELGVREYQSYLPLTQDEITLLPLCLKLTHAMHLLNANYELNELNNMTQENMYYLTNGRIGLQYTNTLWS